MTATGTILVAQDLPESLGLLVDLLAARGFQVHPVDTGELALAYAATSPLDLILLGMRLPGTNGFQVLERLKADAKTRSIPVILLGTRVEAEDMAHGLELGAVDFVFKPFREAELVARVRSHLGLAEFRNQLERQVADQTLALAAANQGLRAEVAERKRTEARLLKAEERFRTIFEESSMGIAWYDAHGGFQQANPSFLGIFGVKDPALIFAGNLFAGAELPEAAKDRLRRGLTVVQELPVEGHGHRWGAEMIPPEIRLLDFQILPVGQGTDGLEGFLLQVRDVTDRRRAEKALLESQRQLASIYDAVGDVVFLLAREEDRKFRFASVNQAFYAVTGLTREEVLGCCVEEVLAEPSIGRAQEMYRQAIEQRSTVRWEESSDYPSGRLTGEVGISPIFDARGDCTHLVGSIHDISERKSHEAILQSRTRLAEESVALDLEGLLRATLDEAEALTGSVIGFFHFVDRDQETLQLQAWSTRTEKEFCSAAGKGSHYPVGMAGIWADAVREGRPLIHNDYPSHPGRKGLPEGHAEVLRELVVPVARAGRIVAVLGVGNKATPYIQADVKCVQRLADLAWDLAERKRAEEDLRQSQWQLRLVADYTYDWEFWMDPAGRFIYSSPSCQRITGIAPAALPDRAALEALIHPEDLGDWLAHFATSREEGSHGAVNFRILHPDGNPRWIAHLCQPVHVEGRYLGQRGSNREITEQVQAAAERKALEDQVQKLLHR